MATCAEAFEAYDAKRQERCRKQKQYEKSKRVRNNLAASLGLSITAVLAVAGALTAAAAAAATGFALPVAIGTAIGIIGYAAIFIGIAALGGLIAAIISVIVRERELDKLRKEESDARAALIKINAEDQKELRSYLSVPPGC